MKVQNGLARITTYLVVISMLFGFILIPSSVASAEPAMVVISQVYGGGGNSGAPLTHDFVELFNRSSEPVSLAGWSIQYASATGTGNFGANSTQLTELPDVTLQPGQYFLVQQSGGTVGAPLPTPDFIDPTPIAMAAGAGKVALVSGTASLGCNGGSTPCSEAQLARIIDLVGYGNANFFEGNGAAPTLSNTTAAFRQDGGCVDTDNNAADFTAGAPAPRNSSSPANRCGKPAGVGAASPTVVGVGETTLLTVTVTPGFDPVSLELAVVADLSAIGGSSTQAFFDDGSNGDESADDLVFSYLTTVADGTSLGNKVLPFTVSDEQGRSTVGNINMTVRPALVRIHTIQGAAHRSPLEGQLVAARGIVTAKAGNGFYMQEMEPDDDDATSEGLFVFTSAAPLVNTGDQVLVTGTVVEFRPGGTATANLTLTEISSPGRSVTVESNFNPLPTPVVIGLGGRVPPTEVIFDGPPGDVDFSGVFDPENNGLDFYESMEAMLVQVNDAVAVGPRNNFGEIAVVSDFGAYAGLRTSRGGIVIRPGDFNPERIILDDTLLFTPQVSVGDTFMEPVVGVLDYSFGNYKLYITEPIEPVSGGLEREFAEPGPEHKLSVATFNVENLSPLDDISKFNELADLIVHNLQTPDVLALEEIQDNSGPNNNGVVDADETFALLIQAIQGAGGPLYEYRQINPVDGQDGGQPGGNIRVGFLFNPMRVTFVDRPGGTSTDATGVVAGADGPELSFSPGRIDPTNPAFNASRKPLAAEFSFNGDRVFMVANHFNSKGGDDPLFGRFQPPVLYTEVQRLQQAQVVADFVSQILALDPQANILVLGDLNDFQFSPPIQVLKDAGMHTLVETLPESERYTYVFDGNSQVLDHIMVSDRLINAPFLYDIVHVNAEFHDQVSDHEPQVAFLCVDRTAPEGTVVPSHDLLWPPNHKYVTVSASVLASDNSGVTPEVTLVSVTSNEPDNGVGDGNTINDIVILDDYTFLLRAERSEYGSGRIYTITYLLTDGCGNTSLATAVVFVPVEQ